MSCNVMYPATYAIAMLSHTKRYHITLRKKRVFHGKSNSWESAYSPSLPMENPVRPTHCRDWFSPSQRLPAMCELPEVLIGAGTFLGIMTIGWHPLGGTSMTMEPPIYNWEYPGNCGYRISFTFIRLAANAMWGILWETQCQKPKAWLGMMLTARAALKSAVCSWEFKHVVIGICWHQTTKSHVNSVKHLLDKSLVLVC